MHIPDVTWTDLPVGAWIAAATAAWYGAMVFVARYGYLDCVMSDHGRDDDQLQFNRQVTWIFSPVIVPVVCLIWSAVTLSYLVGVGSYAPWHDRRGRS